MKETCSQCGLPLGRRPIRRAVEGREEAFCCYGCYLTLQITRERGEEGKAQTILLRLGLGIFFAVNVMMFSLPTYFPSIYPAEAAGLDSARFLFFLRVFLLVFSIPVLLLLGLPILWSSLRQMAQIAINVDVLIALGTFAAYGVSVYNTLRGAAEVYFDTASMLLVLVTLGRYLEARSRARASESLQGLLGQMPATARVLRGKKTAEVAVEEVAVGDRVRILPGESFPVDGLVEEGTGGVDESSLTGESEPVFKEPGAAVHSGTFSLDGTFVVRAERASKDSTAARLARLLEEAKRIKAPIQQAADRVAAVFVPAVMLLALAVFVYWGRRVGAEEALLTSLSVLVVSCPCALGIATPMALWLALGQAARRGILVRTGGVFEVLPRLRRIYFDKTGTLTSGTLRFSRAFIDPDAETDEPELLERVRALMAQSSHPMAASFLGATGNLGDPSPVRDFRSHPGLGIEGKVGSAAAPLIFVGSARFMQEQNQAMSTAMETAVAEAEASGESTALVGWCGRVRAALFFREELRPEVPSTLTALQRMGLGVGILTGDRKPLSRLFGDQVRGAEIHGGLLPEDKVAAITHSRGAQGPTAMVGDGLNDAAALAAADVGMAVGTGTDLTREAASVNFVGSDLAKIPWLLSYSRKVRHRIWGNLFWAFSYNLVAIGLATAGLLNPLIAALAMIFSSLFVVVNSQRLRRG